jgi:hypothetical protein
MSQIQSVVNPQAIPDGQSTVTARSGRMGDLIVSELHGKYYEQSSRGRAFFGTSASTGIALIVPATTGGHPTLFNPLGSGVNVNIIRLEMSYVSGTNAPTSIEWAQTANAGAVAATGAPIATFTSVAPVPTLIGSKATSNVQWAPTTNTFTAAPVFVRPTGFSLFTATAASAIDPTVLIATYDGDLGIVPGTALSLCSQAATTTSLFQVSVVWEEIPV